LARLGDLASVRFGVSLLALSIRNIQWENNMDVSRIPVILTKSSRVGLIAGFERRMVRPVYGIWREKGPPLPSLERGLQLSYEIHTGRGLKLIAPVSVGFL
jgi:hypothetical protein